MDAANKDFWIVASPLVVSIFTVIVTVLNQRNLETLRRNQVFLGEVAREEFAAVKSTMAAFLTLRVTVRTYADQWDARGAGYFGADRTEKGLDPVFQDAAETFAKVEWLLPEKFRLSAEKCLNTTQRVSAALGQHEAGIDMDEASFVDAIASLDSLIEVARAVLNDLQAK